MKLTPFAKLFITAVILVVVGYAFWTRRHAQVRDAAAPGPATSAPTASEVRVVLRLTGSNTIGSSLVPALAEAFLVKRGARDVRRAAGTTTEDTLVVGQLPGETTPSAVHVSSHGSSDASSARSEHVTARAVPEPARL
jgi:hypothetical protein